MCIINGKPISIPKTSNTIVMTPISIFSSKNTKNRKMTNLIILKSLVKITRLHEKASKIGPSNCKIWLYSQGLKVTIVSLKKNDTKKTFRGNRLMV